MIVDIEQKILFKGIIDKELFINSYSSTFNILESLKKSLLDVDNDSALPENYLLSLISYQYDWFGLLENWKAYTKKTITFEVRKIILKDLYTYQDQTLKENTISFLNINNSRVERLMVSSDFYNKDHEPRNLLMDVVNVLEQTITNIAQKLRIEL